MSDDVIFDCQKHIGLITLNRPTALNALTLPMILALQEQLVTWNHDDDIHAIVIQSNSEKAFCAGGDVRWLYEMGQKDSPRQMEFFWHEYRLNHYIHHLSKPYISLMNGITMGGGVGISLHGSHPIASENFSFAMPETTIGFFPDIGASHILSKCHGAYGIYLGLTGSRIGPQDALRQGLVKYSVQSHHFNELLSALIENDLSSEAYHLVDSVIGSFATDNENFSVSHQQKIDKYFNYREVQDIFDALEKDSHDDWCAKMLKNLKHKSPLSLKVSLKQLLRANGMSLADCLNMDFNLVHHFMHAHDFYEGVRALLVDKDRTPSWEPASLTSVQSEMVKRYFEPPLTSLNFIND